MNEKQEAPVWADLHLCIFWLNFSKLRSKFFLNIGFSHLRIALKFTLLCLIMGFLSGCGMAAADRHACCCLRAAITGLEDRTSLRSAAMVYSQLLVKIGALVSITRRWQVLAGQTSSLLPPIRKQDTSQTHMRHKTDNYSGQSDGLSFTTP